MSPSAIAEVVQQDPLVVKLHTNGLNLTKGHSPRAPEPAAANGMKRSEFLLARNIHKDFPVITGGKGNFLFTKDGRRIFDASSGAAVSCLGHGNERITNAVHDQMKSGTPYLASGFWACEVVDELCKELISGTEGKMARVYLTGSGKL
jgi:adenosylmethionine-8-amino-7-oxononanoate aminotransferase